MISCFIGAQEQTEATYLESLTVQVSFCPLEPSKSAELALLP